MRIEKKATLVSISTAAVLVVMKMFVGLISGSIAVLASAIDSLLDLAVSLFNFFALHHAEKDPDEKFNFGRKKIEPLAAMIEGTIITFSGIFILYEAVLKIIHHRPTTNIEESIAVMIISVILTAALVTFLSHIGKKTGNMVIRADALHYKTDLFSNVTVLIALGVIHFTEFELIDPILGIVIALYMIKSAIPIIKEGVLMLLDASLPVEDLEKIEAIINDEHSVTSHHHLKTRLSGSEIFLSVHLVYNVSISLYDAHQVSDKIEAEIKKLFPDKEMYAIIHMDPYDDSDINALENSM